MLGENFLSEDKKGTGLYPDRFDVLSAWHILQIVVQRTPLIPGKRLDALGREGGVVVAGEHLHQSIFHRRAEDEG